MSGAVATSQPDAVAVGAEVLRSGGNAVDAAIAVAAALTVVEPTSNGIGGDAFALIWTEGHLCGFNESGRAPALFDAAQLGAEVMPEFGWPSVTIPGAVDAWYQIHQRFGRLPFAEVIAPSIHLAESGFVVTPVVAKSWASAAHLYGRFRDKPEFAQWFATFTNDGVAPKVGDRTRLLDHAKTLHRIAGSGGRDLYEGQVAAAIDTFSRQTGGWLRINDLAAHKGEWVTPLSCSYRDHKVWELPANGQGITALIALNILDGFSGDSLARDNPDAWHLQIEATKLAFADAMAYVADPNVVEVPEAGLLSEAYAATRRTLISDRAGLPQPGNPPRGGTVYLCTADESGMMVSFIQSNYEGFGSGIVVPGTGVALQNRGANFLLDPAHPNHAAPGKRPYHTIIPGG